MDHSGAICAFDNNNNVLNTKTTTETDNRTTAIRNMSARDMVSEGQRPLSLGGSAASQRSIPHNGTLTGPIPWGAWEPEPYNLTEEIHTEDYGHPDWIEQSG